MWCAPYVSIIKCTPKTKEGQFLALAGTTHLTQTSEAGHFLNKTFAAKTSRHADLKTIFPNCSLCIKHIKLIRRGLTQTSNYFCCPYPRAKGLSTLLTWGRRWVLSWFAVISASHWVCLNKKKMGKTNFGGEKKSPRNNRKLLNVMSVFS